MILGVDDLSTRQDQACFIVIMYTTFKNIFKSTKCKVFRMSEYPLPKLFISLSPV
jgi:hypothetical protein